MKLKVGKKITLVATVFLMSLIFVFANGPVETNYTFKSVSVDEEVAMDVVRGAGDVKLHILIKDMSKYDHIIIERSAETPNYFGKCKYINCADTKTEKGYMLQVDKYPFSATKDVYYRIKTVTKDGVEREYPAVLLASAAQ